MLMFLTILFLSAGVLTVTCLVAAGPAPYEKERIAALERQKLAVPPPQFFADEMPAPAPPVRPEVPIEVLLSQIQRHVRLEQAAAESFIELPAPGSLHSRTSSPLVN